jgi:hypothetical protein
VNFCNNLTVIGEHIASLKPSKVGVAFDEEKRNLGGWRYVTG